MTPRADLRGCVLSFARIKERMTGFRLDYLKNEIIHLLPPFPSNSLLSLFPPAAGCLCPRCGCVPSPHTLR